MEREKKNSREGGGEILGSDDSLLCQTFIIPSAAVALFWRRELSVPIYRLPVAFLR